MCVRGENGFPLWYSRTVYQNPEYKYFEFRKPWASSTCWMLWTSHLVALGTVSFSEFYRKLLTRVGLVQFFFFFFCTKWCKKLYILHCICAPVVSWRPKQCPWDWKPSALGLLPGKERLSATVLLKSNSLWLQLFAGENCTRTELWLGPCWRAVLNSEQCLNSSSLISFS